MDKIHTAEAIAQHEHPHAIAALDAIGAMLEGEASEYPGQAALHIAARGWRAFESALRLHDADEADVVLQVGAVSRTFRGAAL